jgi:ABC-2 type transport system permease protein
MMGSLGLIAGLWAEKFDQMAGLPELHHHADDVSLAGVFYSVIRCLRSGRVASHLNPGVLLHVVDGFRRWRRFFGVSD